MGTSGSKGIDGVSAVAGVGSAAAGLGTGGEAGEGGAAEAWHGGAQLYVSLKMENARITGDLVPHVYGSEPIIGSWDPSRALAMERELASMWQLSFVVPPDHETLDFKFLLKPKDAESPCIIEEGPTRLLTGGMLEGDVDRDAAWGAHSSWSRKRWRGEGVAIVQALSYGSVFTMSHVSSTTAINGSSRDVYVRATKILSCVVKELGGSKPIYENVFGCSSRVEYKVSFNVPAKGREGMAKVVLYGLSPGATSREDACDIVARDAILLLQDQHDLNLLDFSGIHTKDLSDRCVVLLDKYIECEELFSFTKDRCYTVADGIFFSSDVFLNKANEVENLANSFDCDVTMSKFYRDCAIELQNIAQASIDEMERERSLTQSLQKHARSKLARPYAVYDKIFMKVGESRINSGLKVVLDEVVCRAGYQPPILKVTDSNDGGYLGSVYLFVPGNPSPPDAAHVINGKSFGSTFEAATSAMHRAIEFLKDSCGLTIMDPNFYWNKELGKIEVAMQKEASLLAIGAAEFEEVTRIAIIHIHELADKYNGSVCPKDKEISGLLIAMCVDLTHRLRPATKRIYTARMKYGYIGY